MKETLPAHVPPFMFGEPWSRLLPGVVALSMLSSCACDDAADNGDSEIPPFCLARGAASTAPPRQLPRASGFVTRKDGRLFSGSLPFRFAGANVYWLGLDEGAQTYPSAFRQDEALLTVVELGGTVVRSHSLGISTGTPLSFEPERGLFNERALAAADRAIRRAGELGLRLIIPLTDNYRYYHGGRWDFTRWRAAAGDDFYRSDAVIGDFEEYVSRLLNHVNGETGLRWKDDPTILAWELGNELHADGGDATLLPWMRRLASFLKSQDSHHLVSDGAPGLADPSKARSIPEVDLHSAHYYGCRVEPGIIDRATETYRDGKVSFLGELDWTHGKVSDFEDVLGRVLAEDRIAGDLLWSVWAHGDEQGWTMGDPYSLRAPGINAGQQWRIDIFRSHAFAMSGAPTPAWSPPPEPAGLSVVGGALHWRGALGAAAYRLEVAETDRGPWREWCGGCLADTAPGWVIPSELRGLWGRIVPLACDGTAGTASRPVALVP